MTAAPLTRAPIAEAVTLRAGPSHRALYLVHTLGGELLSYRELARAMRSPLRVLGLAWLPPEQCAAMPLEEMAAVHWKLLRSIQPHGPYLLAGWSFGGVLAYELARQIQADGAIVEFLGLLDANPVRESITGEPARDTRLSEKLTSLLTSLERGAERAALAALRSDPRLRNLLGDIPDGVSPARVRTLLRVTLALTESARTYRAAPSTVPVDLFQPDQVAAATQACLHEELRPLAQGGLYIHYVPGDHYAMLRPPLVEALAKALDDALTTANKRTLSLAGELT
jgi:thioesterase domain-containing protein